MPHKSIILFDGVCNLCNGAVQFVIKRDKHNSIQFAPLQTETAHKLLADHHLPIGEMQSFILIENGNAYTRSTAALRVCRYLKGLWPLMYGLIIVPKFIRDGIYNWIARNRYRWFGQKNECMIPTPELQSKFLN
ncbi:MAG: thiol-disulfide oxidoreductase DCC family protein [Bacteroidota bacterium]|nr:thiol-disulfide oxidoreductase DCC family protein [Bacteroidota bacterium]MDQ6889711.1 thiol-disulfide oxidoreductase DCC family protein [Bacteroidota bacterium]